MIDMFPEEIPLMGSSDESRITTSQWSVPHLKKTLTVKKGKAETVSFWGNASLTVEEQLAWKTLKESCNIYPEETLVSRNLVIS